MTLSAFAAISIDSWHAAPAGHSAANEPHDAGAVDRLDRRKDTQTLCSAYYAGSVENKFVGVCDD